MTRDGSSLGTGLVAVVIEVSVPAYLILFVAESLQIYILLWATASIARVAPGAGRLAAGAVFGAVYDVLADLGRKGVLGFGEPLASLSWALLAFVMSFLIAFWVLGWRWWKTLFGYYVLLAILGMGTATAVLNFYPAKWVGPAVAIATTLIAAEAGWGVVQRWMWQRLLYVPITVRLGDKTIHLTALVDTGNNLKDPIGGAPVLVLGADTAPKLLAEERPSLIKAIITSDIGAIDAEAGVSKSNLFSRLRLIPFSSLGRDKGLLVGLRVDDVTIPASGQEKVTLPGVVVGFHQRSLSPEGTYQALIHPDLLFRAATQKGSRGRLWGDRSQTMPEGTSSH